MTEAAPTTQPEGAQEPAPETTTTTQDETGVNADAEAAPESMPPATEVLKEFALRVGTAVKLESEAERAFYKQRQEALCYKDFANIFAAALLQNPNAERYFGGNLVDGHTYENKTVGQCLAHKCFELAKDYADTIIDLANEHLRPAKEALDREEASKANTGAGQPANAEA